MTQTTTKRLLSLFAMAIIPALALADDWPTAMHDNQRTGVTAESLRPPLDLTWEFQPDSPPAAGWSLPVNGYGARKNKPNVSYDDAPRVIVVGDTCYFCASGENCVYAVDAMTGRPYWTHRTEAAPRLAPAYWQEALYVGADDGVFRCLDARDGSLRWQVAAAPRDDLVLGQGRFGSVWPIRAAGIVDQGVAYFTAGLFPYEHLYFYAVDASDGSIRWCRQLDDGGRLEHVPQGYILSTPQTLFTTSRAIPARWDKLDGARIDFSTPFPDVPNAHEYRFYNGGSDAQIWGERNIVYGQACLLAYDPDGERNDRWGRTQKGQLLFNWFNARQVVFQEETAYLATDYHLLAVPQSRLDQLAREECRQFEETYKRLRVADYLENLERRERLVQELGPNHQRVRELEQGPLRWGSDNWEKWQAAKPALFEQFARKCTWMTPLQATESLILAGDTIYAGGEDAVVAVDAGNGKPLWNFPTGSRARGLAVANGRLFVSTVDGRVRCFAAMDGRFRRGMGFQPVRKTEERQTGNHSHDLAAATNASWIDELPNGTTNGNGYCLIVGGRNARLAVELAQRTSHRIELTPAAEVSIDALRRELVAAGLYGGRVCVREVHAGQLAYPPYVFNLVIEQSETARDIPIQELFRVTKPCGGVLCVHESSAAATESSSRDEVLKAFSEQNASLSHVGGRLAVVRGPIPGAADWTHNYANAANTYCSEDPHVRGPFGMLWYGKPGPRKRIDRHAAPPMPLVSGGIMFTIGYDVVMAHDVYNGVLIWEREILGVTRQHLPINTSNTVADDRSLFLVVADGHCLRLNASTGETIGRYSLPAEANTQKGLTSGTWAWIAMNGRLLYGSRAEFDVDRRRAVEQTSDLVFALDKDTGEPVWTYIGAGIDHDGIAMADGAVFLVNRDLTEAQRDTARAAGTASGISGESVPDRPAVDRRGEPIPPDLRKLVALDAATGRQRWSRPLNLTDVTLDDIVVQGRGGVACMVKDGVVVVHGTGSLGHPHKEFLSGEFDRRALVAFDCANGELLWGGRKGYRKRPIIVGDQVYAEPFAWNLHTGEQKTIANPLSCEEQLLDFHRGYIGCGHLLASATTLFGAKEGIGYWNLDDASGFRPFDGVDLACGLGAVPAAGVFVAPEGRSGCTCDVPIHTSLALYPKPDADDWGLGFAGGRAPVRSLPVRTVSINLGAPGYRQDVAGNLWIPYPARVDAGLIGDWLPTYQHDQQMCFRLNELTSPIDDTDIPWVYRTGYSHDKLLRFRLIEQGGAPCRYTVRLFFAEPEDLTAGQRIFSVQVQGNTVLEDFDIVRTAGAPHRAIVREFPDIEVDGELQIRLLPVEESDVREPVLCGFQAICQ